MKETPDHINGCQTEMGLISSFPEHSSEPCAAQATRVNRHLPETELPALYPPNSYSRPHETLLPYPPVVALQLCLSEVPWGLLS